MKNLFSYVIFMIFASQVVHADILVESRQLECVLENADAYLDHYRGNTIVVFLNNCPNPRVDISDIRAGSVATGVNIPAGTSSSVISLLRFELVCLRDLLSDLTISLRESETYNLTELLNARCKI